MSLLVHTSVETITDNIPLAYFKKEYLKAQNHPNFRAYSMPNLFIAFQIAGELAISIPRSPFGSFFTKRNTNSFDIFWNRIKEDLANEGVKHVEIRNPASIYDSFTKSEIIKGLGFQILYSDLNQHISLNKNVAIHQMQERKLKALKNEGFEFKKMENSLLETAHKFLTVCRQAQGLQINISWEQLKKLNEQLPGVYECFGVFREEKISALCITVKVTDSIAYYYLPGTSPMFRNQSPMVMLIDGMVQYYKEMRFEYLDMGVSSYEGKVQETLKVFKERMGAEETEKITFTTYL
ncbi:MAG: GNAT family N-acetyltransferase [Bacteroidota bacterium]